MMITTKGRNALKVMADLAQHYGEGYVPLSDIAQRVNESPKYLELAMSRLSAAGLVDSARGKSGGYRLSRDPEKINTAEVILCAEGTLAPVSCLYSDTPCEYADTCLTLPLWKELDDVIMNFLTSRTLADLVK